MTILAKDTEKTLKMVIFAKILNLTRVPLGHAQDLWAPIVGVL